MSDAIQTLKTQNDPIIELLKGRLDSSPQMTQAILADQIGISPQFLSEILNNKRNPSKKVLDFLDQEKVVTYRPRQVAPRQAASSTPSSGERRARNRRRA